MRSSLEFCDQRKRIIHLKKGNLRKFSLLMLHGRGPAPDPLVAGGTRKAINCSSLIQIVEKVPCYPSIINSFIIGFFIKKYVSVMCSFFNDLVFIFFHYELCMNILSTYNLKNSYNLIIRALTINRTL